MLQGINIEKFIQRRHEEQVRERDSHVSLLHAHIAQLQKMTEENMFPPTYYGEVQQLITAYKDQIKALEGVKL